MESCQPLKRLKDKKKKKKKKKEGKNKLCVVLTEVWKLRGTVREIDKGIHVLRLGK
jgi:hypothetical protein